MTVEPERSPTVQTLALVVVVFAAQQLVSTLALDAVSAVFILALPLSVNPWTIVTSVYAHASLGHLLVNAVALLVVGLVVERAISRLRFHVFFVTTGALAGVVQVVASVTATASRMNPSSCTRRLGWTNSNAALERGFAAST